MSRRIRTIKPEVLIDDERAAGLSDAAWRLWVGLRLLADDFGVARAGERYLAGRIWQDTSRAKRVAAARDELAAGGYVSTYRVGADLYLRIAGWDEEQRLDRRSEKTRLPDPTFCDVEVIQDVRSLFAATRRDPPPPAATDGDVAQVAAHARTRARGRDSDPETDPETDLGHRPMTPAPPQPGPNPEPIRPAEPDVPVLTLLPVDPPLPPKPELKAGVRYAYAYARGILEGGAHPIPPPTGFLAERSLLAAIKSHALGADKTPLRGPDLEAWIQREAAAFARRADDWTRRRGYPPGEFAKFLNGRGAPTKGVQPAPPGTSPTRWSDRNKSRGA